MASLSPLVTAPPSDSTAMRLETKSDFQTDSLILRYLARGLPSSMPGGVWGKTLAKSRWLGSSCKQGLEGARQLRTEQDLGDLATRGAGGGHCSRRASLGADAPQGLLGTDCCFAV